MNVTQILKLKGSQEVETISPRATVREAAQTLGEKRYGALVVSHGDGTVSGILSERDVVRGLGREGAAILEKPVSSLMTADVQSCARNESSDAVLERMTNGRFRHMPVIEDGKMVGFLSIGDVVKARLFEMQEENAAMQTMLHG
ncbi:MAG: CBS domain-containing protein [Pseudomonadota bacterium]